MGFKKKKDEDEEAVVHAPSFLTPPSGQKAEDEETFISMKDIPDLVEMVAIGDKPSQANPLFSIKSGPILMPSSLQNDGNVENSVPKMDLSSSINKLELKMDILSQRMPSQQPNPESAPIISLPSQTKEESKPKVAGSSPPLLDLIDDIKDILASALDKPESKGGFVPIPNRAAILAAKSKNTPQPPNLSNPFIALEVSSSNVITPPPTQTPSTLSTSSAPVPLPQFNPPPTVKPTQVAPTVSTAPLPPENPLPAVKPTQVAPTVSAAPLPPVNSPPIVESSQQESPPSSPLDSSPLPIIPNQSNPAPTLVDPFADIFANISPAQPASIPSIPSAPIPIQSYFSSDILTQFQANEINIEWTLPEINQKIQEITFQRQGIQEMLDGLTEAFMNQRIALEQYSEQEGQATGYINKMNLQLQLLQELQKVRGAL